MNLVGSAKPMDSSNPPTHREIRPIELSRKRIFRWWLEQDNGYFLGNIRKLQQANDWRHAFVEHEKIEYLVGYPINPDYSLDYTTRSLAYAMPTAEAATLSTVVLLVILRAELPTLSASDFVLYE
jgi:hypothetical protein